MYQLPEDFIFGGATAATKLKELLKKAVKVQLLGMIF